MRKIHNIFMKIIVSLLFVIFIGTAAAQIILHTTVDGKNILLENEGRGEMLSTMTWEDLFDNGTKIDTNPPGSGQTDNYLISNGQVSMMNTYPAWTDPE